MANPISHNPPIVVTSISHGALETAFPPACAMVLRVCRQYQPRAKARPDLITRAENSSSRSPMIDSVTSAGVKRVKSHVAIRGGCNDCNPVEKSRVAPNNFETFRHALQCLLCAVHSCDSRCRNAKKAFGASAPFCGWLAPERLDISLRLETIKRGIDCAD